MCKVVAGLVGVLVFCIAIYKSPLAIAKELNSWKELYETEYGKSWEAVYLDTIPAIDRFYFGEDKEKHIETKFLLARKAYLLDKTSALERRSEFVKELITLTLTLILPEVFTLILVGVNQDNPQEAIPASLIILCGFLAISFCLLFTLLCNKLKSSKTRHDMRDEYELRCIDRLINEHFENL